MAREVFRITERLIEAKLFIPARCGHQQTVLNTFRKHANVCSGSTVEICLYGVWADSSDEIALQKGTGQSAQSTHQSQKVAQVMSHSEIRLYLILYH